jgi:predicted ATPase
MTLRLERAFTSRFAELPDSIRTLLLLAAASDADELHELFSAAEFLVPGVAHDPDSWSTAVEAGLVTMDERRIEFRHPLVRSAIYQSATPAQRASTHAALAKALEARPDRRVWHLAAATLGPNEEVAAEIEAAATRAEAR